MNRKRRSNPGQRYLWLVAAGFLALAGNAEADGKRPNVLLIVSDDQRADTIHALGNHYIDTPHLDALVKRGVSITRANSANPICTPSRAEILTGCTSFRNGVIYFGGKIAPELPTIAKTMTSAGYSAWYSGKWMNDGSPISHGYQETEALFSSGGGDAKAELLDSQGRKITGYRGWTFKKYDGTVELEKGNGLTSETDGFIADGAIEFLNRKPEKPFFLHVNFTAPHDPLMVHETLKGKYEEMEMPIPPNFLPEHEFDYGNLRGRDELLLPFPRTVSDVRKELADYYAVIENMDRQLGRVLEALEASGQRDNTLVIFSSDHGLGKGSHGIVGKQNMYEHTLKVPLIFSGPRIPEDKVLDPQCYLRDLYPTICQYTGVPIPDSVEGKSLIPLLLGEKKSIYDFTVSYYRESQRMIRTDRWKYILYPEANRAQLFDLQNDPYEMRNLIGRPDTDREVTDLKAKLKEWLIAHGDPVGAEM
ncbi:MAG: sulfatase-like hydrolase/transferase [Verrucomicrobiales bacterium]|nr:sulfatase-like hydrolase/transferase [Verrucomicrobiales bacterium]HQZ28294.1 sulfatase-like hydrolase/transferase [Verrucomicrobiales bacterium]